MFNPIFHCNAKLLILGTCVGLDPQQQYFALPIPTCWYLKSLADPTRATTDPTRVPTDPLQALTDPTQAKRKQVEYRSRWSPRVGARVGHVHYMLFVSIETTREPHGPNASPNASRWNVGHVGSPRIGAYIGHVDYVVCVNFICFG